MGASLPLGARDASPEDLAFDDKHDDFGLGGQGGSLCKARALLHRTTNAQYVRLN
jgi:hypothetical protein